MNIKFIGTGGAFFASSNNASYLIDEKILVDLPNGGCRAMTKMDIDISKIDHILITHFHGDHYFDIPFI